MPTNLSLEDIAKFLKGESSHWINEGRLTAKTFRWCKGYAGFSVSPSILEKVCRFIDNQEEFHQHVSFEDEFRELVRLHGLTWYGNLE